MITQRTPHDCAACCIAQVTGIAYEDARAGVGFTQLHSDVPAPYPSEIARAVEIATLGSWSGIARPIRTGPAKPGDLVLMAGLGKYPGWHCVVLLAGSLYYDPADGGSKPYDPAKAMYVIELHEAQRP